MKKIVIAVLLISVCLLTGCKKDVSNESFVEGLVEYNTNLSSYYSEVSLEIYKGEETIKFDCEIYYLADDYYKVIMKDLQTNNTQAILRNEDGVSVLTPALNKQFKFTNDWPLNSSHAYLYQSLIKDIVNDKEYSVVKDDKNYVVTSSYDSKTNASLKKQKVTFCESYKPLYCIVLNENEEVQIKATFNKFVDKYTIKKSDFNANSVTTSLRLEMGDGYTNVDIQTVKPTFAPENTDIASSHVADDYIIYSYNGDSNYTITCQVVEEDAVLTTYRMYEDVVLLSNGVGAMNENSITFYQGNIQVTVYSDTLDLNVLTQIADSF